MGIVALFKRWFGKSSDGSATAGGSRTNENGHGKDLTLVCVDCRKEFVFEAGEQEFYKMRGLTPPKRCTSCRTKRKQQRRR